MCGIAGILGPADRTARPVLARVAASLAHRGPDDEGVGLVGAGPPDRQLALIHRRLSIIDLSPAGHQPMRDPESGASIVFNGEIYNYRDVRADLTALGHTFHSQSDTEVILKAYAQWHERCVDRLAGMFAFAIWDPRRQRLLLAVDRFGIKPLYYGCTADGFVFASEVRAALATGAVPAAIEPRAVESFIAVGAVHAPLTMVRGLHSLLPAHVLTYDCRTGDTHLEQYWRPAPRTRTDDSAASEVRRVEQALRDAVRRHLVSDVPLGIFLSGGVDSSSLALLVSRTAEGKALQSFSVAFAEPQYTEGRYARLIAERIGCRHHETVLSEDEVYRSLPGALAAMDQPSIDGINTYTIARAVHEAGIKAVLSGQGGDEVFGGYNTFSRIPRALRALRWTERLVPAASRRWLGDRLMRHGSGSIAQIKAGQALCADADLLSVYAISRQLFSPETRRRLHPGAARGCDAGLPSETRDWLRREISGLDEFSAISMLEMRSYLANMLLRDGDVMSMAHGVEVRVPFLDHELVDLVFTLDATTKRGGRRPKPLLLDAVEDGLPPEIYRRPKMGFTFPWEIWLRQKSRAQLESTLSDAHAADHAGLAAAEVRRLWNAFLAGDAEVTWSRIWALYVLLTWTRRHLTA